MKNNTLVSEVKDINTKAESATIWKMIAFLIIVCAALYANTLYNNYCLDDVMVITENASTLKGFAGIKDHLTKDYLFGYMRQESADPLSPWRPLSLISFSIEVGIWGVNHPAFSHLINVLLYTLTVLLLFLLLTRYLSIDKWTAFFASLFFAIHPIHTEVVANIKSRDEILSLLMMLSSLLLLWKYISVEKKKYLFFSLLIFFLALLSKENAITFVAGIPILLHFFSDLKKNKILGLSAWYLLTAVIYLLIRFSVLHNSQSESDVSNDGFLIINYPFLFANGSEAFFTKIYILLKYIILLVFPYPLSFDYSYRQIPYVNAGNPMVWIAFAVYGSLLFYAIKNFKKKNIIACCMLLFLITFSLAMNLFFDIAVTIGERLLYMPSLFFCLAIVHSGKLLFIQIEKKWSIHIKLLTTIAIIPVLLLCSFVVINRNKDWKDMDTLNFADYKKSPNSVRMNDALGNYYLRNAESKNINAELKIKYLQLAIPYYKKAVELYPEFENDLINIAICYERLGNSQASDYYWKKLKDVAPNNTRLRDYYHYQSSSNILKGIKFTEQNAFDSSFFYLSKAVQTAIYNDSVTVQAYYHIAGLYYKMEKYQEAHDALGKVLALDPNNKTAQLGYQSCEAILKKNKK